MKSRVKAPSVKPCSHGEYRFVLVSYFGGKRARRYFLTRREAEVGLAEEAAIAAQMPSVEGPLTSEERAAVLEARRLNVGLMEAVLAFYDSEVVRLQSSTLGALVEDRLRVAEVQKASEVYRQNLRWFFDRVVLCFGSETNAASITTAQCQEFLHGQGWGDVSLRYYRTILKGLFNHGVKHGKCPGNPAALVPVPKLPDDEGVSVLTPAECLDLLRGCSDKILPGILISLFAGLRPESEMQRLDWAQVKLDEGFIEVMAKKSKSAQRRLVHVEPVLRAWLKSWRKKLPTAGPVWPADVTGRRHWRSARLAAGWGEGEGLRPWPQDVLRHTFASYHFARGKNANATAAELGHASTKKLFSNYRGVVTGEAAGKFWGLRPGRGGVASC